MHSARILLPVLLALTAAGCAQQEQHSYLIDPATGRATPMVFQSQPPQPQYAQQTYQPAPQRAPAGERGLFNWSSSAPSAPVVYAQAPQPQPYAQDAAPRTVPPPPSGMYLPPPNTALAANSLY
jgi:hypothetical protein